MPRTPKVERAPKPRMEICSPARSSRGSAPPRGHAGSDSERLMRSWLSRISSRVITLTEQHIKPQRSLRVR